MNKKMITALSLIMAAGILMGADQVYAGSLPTDTIAEGVYINDLDMSGKTVSEAVSTFDDYVQGKMNSTITLNINNNFVKVKASDLGLSADTGNVVQTAFEYGKDGNYVQRYKVMKDLQREPYTITVPFTIDEEKVRDVVENQCTVYDVAATDATVTRKSGKFDITPGVTGVKLDVDASVSTIVDYMNTQWNGSDASIDLVCETAEPDATEEDFAAMTDVLGTFTTSYSSSGANRSQNVSNGCSKINGTLLLPGETLSVYNLCNPFTEENGYAVATAYENGMEVDSVGGGICQVSTTLYNAVLKAELEVVERYNHSMIVGYVDPSMDAAIAGTSKDFKFKNNTDYPIYIEGSTSNKKITFTIYGHETRDTANRKVTYESEVLETMEADPSLEYVAADDKAIGYKAITQKAHTGYKAQLWKIVTVNGVQESKEVINKSTYNAAPAYCSVGTMCSDAAQTAAIKAAIATQDNNTIDATIAAYNAAVAEAQAAADASEE